MARKVEMVEGNLFSFAEEKKEETRRGRKSVVKKKVPPAIEKKTAAELWQSKYLEFDITHPSQEIKDTMKEEMLEEGFTKREANRVFKGLFFKEKVCQTRQQAEEYLETVPTSYAVKYKIGIEPSQKMVSLAKRLEEKKSKLTAYETTQYEKKFIGDFISCSHCKSKVNAKYVKPPLCPVCGEDMRTQKVVETLESLKKAVQNLEKRYEETTRKYHSKFTGGEKWIIRLVNPFRDGENREDKVK